MLEKSRDKRSQMPDADAALTPLAQPESGTAPASSRLKAAPGPPQQTTQAEFQGFLR